MGALHAAGGAPRHQRGQQVQHRAARLPPKVYGPLPAHPLLPAARAAAAHLAHARHVAAALRDRRLQPTLLHHHPAITSSSNFRTSNGIDPKTGLARRVHGNMADLNDFMHGWLNYQIEHHAWPQLSMLSYQKSAPQMRALCAKHNVPYVQHSVFRRLKKTADIMVGHTDMRPFDRSWEYEKDLFTWDDQKMAKAAKEIDSSDAMASETF